MTATAKFLKKHPEGPKKWAKFKRKLRFERRKVNQRPTRTKAPKAFHERHYWKVMCYGVATTYYLIKKDGTLDMTPLKRIPDAKKKITKNIDRKNQVRQPAHTDNKGSAPAVPVMRRTDGSGAPSCP